MTLADQILKNSELTGDQIQVIKMVSRPTWEAFFEALEMQQAMRLTGTGTEDLSELKETVKGIQLVKNKFLTAWDTKT